MPSTVSMLRKMVDILNFPPGVNPYHYAAKLLEERRFPTVPQSTFKILQAFGVTHMCIICVCCLVIMVPILISQAKRLKYCWTFKKAFAGKTQKSFYIPNSVLAVAVTQLVSSVLCLLYAYLDYISFKSSKTAAGVYLYAWVQLMWLFGFYGYWITGWSGLCTILCSPLSQIPRPLRPLVTRPQVVNVLGILFPATVTVGTIAWVAILIVAYHHEFETFAQLRAAIVVAGNEFEIDQAVNLKTLVKVGLKFHKVNGELTRRIRWNSFFWAVIGIFTLLLFVLSGWSLIMLLRKGATKLEALKPDNAHLKLSGLSHSLCSDPIQISRVLKRGYVYVVSHFVIMMASMTYKIVICLLIGVNAELVVMNSRWRSLGSWLYLLCGVIVAPAMLLQTWRIFTDLDIIIPESQVGDTHRTMTNCATNLETDSYFLDDFEIHDVKEAHEVPEVQIVQARVATRPTRAQAVVIRRAF
ncbi:hypothetical protein DFH28DRAFT_944304 [Melampsora americana]|nr:hypothetical protein DFH28DRAFT_944304 [Melampsora americana]